MKPNKQPTTSAELSINIADEPHTFTVTVPKKKCSSQAVISFARELTDQTVSAASEAAIRNGQSISCKKGCGACCKQLVPISPTEARYLAKYIASQSAAKRNRWQQRFAEAETKLRDANIWDTLMNAESFDVENRTKFGVDYFKLGIPCPFLEDGACSIHHERPLTCREFLATTPAENCSKPGEAEIESVEIPVKFSNALGNIEKGTRAYAGRWMALITLFAWVKANPEPSQPAKTGPEWVERLVSEVGP